MRNKCLFCGLISLFFIWSLTFAGDLGRVGTVSGTQLLIPVGARSISLGGASVGDVGGAEALFWNVGGIAIGGKSEVMFSNMSYIAGLDLNYLAAVFNGGNIGAFGFHIQSLSFGDIEQTTFDEPEGTGINYSPSHVVAGISYGRALTDRISAGVTGKVVYESIMQTSARALAIDLGVQYAFSNHLRLGVAMKNMGTKMQYSGRDLDRPARIPGAPPDAEDGFFSGNTQNANIPSVFSFGVMYGVNINEDNKFVLNGAFSNLNDASDQIFGGVEYGFKEFFFLRGGYNYEAQAEDQLFGFSFGAGLNYSLGQFDFKFDYAFRQLTEFFDSNNVFTIKLMF
jgi:hypothetical protein